MEASRTSIGQRIAGAGGLLLIVFLFLPWFGAGGGTLNGWEGQSSTDVYLLITALIAIAAAVAGATGLLVPGLTMNGAAALLGGVATIVLLWLALFDGEEREVGMYLSVLAAAMIAAGGYLAAQVEGDATRRETGPRRPRR